jgi:CRP-like cAMP-binding protein
LGNDRGPPAGGRATSVARGNQILRLLPRAALELLEPTLECEGVGLGESLFEPGDDVTHARFPLNSTVVALVLPMRDGRTVEAATIGREGAIGGVVSLGLQPAFARATVQIPGIVARISVGRLEAAKRAVPRVQDVLARYADCLTAQVLQSVGCATLHPLEARCARWLLMTHDRLRQPELPLTQESLAQMFGVSRTYVTRIATLLQERGAISYRRGIIRIVRRSALEESTCECYGSVRRHFERVLPGLYPTEEL